MSRQPRILFDGATYHVMSKGNLGDYVFALSKDKGYFIKLLGEGALKYNVCVFAYCLMGNHCHLLIQTKDKNLPQFMHFLLTSYASYLSRGGRKGHIFAGRYKAILVDADEYLLTVSRYIHLNPVKAALVELPSEYAWSSYPYYLGKLSIPAWFDVNWLIEYFGFDLEKSLLEYRQFVEVDMEEGCEYPNEKIIAQTILGNEEFVKKVKAKGDTSTHEDISYRSIFLKEFPVEEIRKAVCSRFELKTLKIPAFGKDELYGNARKVFIYLARHYALASSSEIAGLLGDIGRSGVSECYRRVKKTLDENGYKVKELECEIAEVMSLLNKCAQAGENKKL